MEKIDNQEVKGLTKILCLCTSHQCYMCTIMINGTTVIEFRRRRGEEEEEEKRKNSHGFVKCYFAYKQYFPTIFKVQLTFCILSWIPLEVRLLP